MVPFQSRKLLVFALACLAAALFYLFLLSDPPKAAALSNPCALDPNNLVVNGSMAAASPDYGVAASWDSFVLSGDPVFEHVDNEQIDPNGSQYFWQDGAAFDAGIYQTVTNLTPGATYHFWLGYALAAYDPGDTVNHRGDWIGRQVGIDAKGGTDPRSPNVTWGSVYWNGIAALNIPALSMNFFAQTRHATIFLRAINTDTRYRNKVWFDSVCMEMTAAAAPPGPIKVFVPMISHVIATPPPPPNCTPGLISTVSVGVHPKGIGTDTVSNRVYVGLYDSSSVAVIDASSNTKIGTWGTNSSGRVNGVAATGGRLFASLRDTSNVAVLDATTGSVITTKAIGALPYGVGAANGKVWVANYGDGSVSVLDAATANVLGTRAIGGGASLVAPALDRAFVSYWDGGVASIDSSASLLNSMTTTGGGSFGVAYNASVNRLYVSNRATNQLAILDASTGAQTKSITLSQTPYAIAYNPNTNRLFVVLADSNNLDVRDGSTLNLITQLSTGRQGGDGGDGIAVMNGRVYVSNNADGTVSVYQDICTR